MRTLNRPELPQAGISPSDIIPDGWTVAPLKRFFRVAGGATPTSDPENWDGDIPWVTPGDLSGLDNFFIGKGKRSITERGYKSCGTELVPVGSVILSTRAPIGSLAIAQERLCTNQGCKALVPTTTVDARFFAYALSVATPQLNALGQGSTFRELSGESLGSFRLPVPSPQEQCRIAAFLDHETARIDELVREQEQLLGQVEAKRAAVIRQFVTKGINASVSLRDSGVGWIGEVPQHWQIDRLKWSQKDVKGGVWGGEPNGDEWDIACIRVADFDRTRGEVRTPIPTIRNVPENERVGRVLSAGDLVLEKSGGGDNQPVGYVVLYANSQPAVCSNFTSRIQIARGMDPSFWRFVHHALYSVRRNVASIKQTSGIQNLDVESYNDELVPYPPAEEQVSIAKRIEAETSALDQLATDVMSGIRLLLERRSALISAAVTGQLDLSDWQPPEPEAVAEVA